MKKNYRRIFLIFVILVVIASFPACDSIANEQLETERLLEQDYSFDPETILDSLGTGKTGIFTLQQMTPSPTDSPSRVTVTWQQADYVAIADAVFKYVWGDEEDGWRLKAMSFSMDCAEVDIGAQWVVFRYVKFINYQEEHARLERHIFINPQEHLISVSEIRITPAGPELEYIDLATLKMTVYEAIQIAETNGGIEARNSVQNECKIFSVLSPNSLYPGWSVDYVAAENSYLISFQINLETGKFKARH